VGAAVSTLASFAALALFALAMDRHHRQAFGRPPSRRTAVALRAFGVLLLLLAPLPWLASQEADIALVTWLFCALPLAGLAAVGLFTWLGERRR